MISKGVKIIILSAGCVIVIGVLIYVLVKMSGSSSTPSTPPPVTSISETVTVPVTVAPVGSVSDEDKQTADLANLSRLFAERFGTLSATGDFTNFEELKILMTSSFSDWVDSSYKKKVASEYNATSKYKSVATQAIAVDVEKETATDAMVVVSCQRLKKNSEVEPLVINEKLEITWVKINDDWRVDGAYWQP